MGHTPYSGKEVPGTGGISSGHEPPLTLTSTSGAAGVVLRATVETFGPAGDAELHLTVKWPASALAQPSVAGARNHSQASAQADDNSYDTEGNIHTERSSPSERSKDKPEV